MRKRVKKGGMSVRAISGTYVIVLGMNIDANSKLLKGLLGFAIHRIDHNDEKKPDGDWLRGYLTFEEKQRDGQRFGEMVSSLDHPIQEFLWSDYTVRAGRKYTYRVVPMYGKPGALTQGKPVEVTVSTESESENEHAVYFNRGVAGSQAYARRFKNKKPDKVPNREAYQWLSRGLEEAMLGFIGKAADKTWSLRAAMYEFQHDRVLKAFDDSRKKGANVRIVFDYRLGKNKPALKNWNAIKKAGITDLVIKRTQNRSSISHNKFIILLKDGKPVEVWTGSTNVTAGGIFGHSNVGHIVRDADVAQSYYEYWQQLSADPPSKEFRPWNEENTPVPALKGKAGISVIFSPRTKLDVLDKYYTKIMDDAKSGVFLTAAFGINKFFKEILEKNKPYLRYLLLESQDSSLNIIKRNLNNQIAVGSLIGNEEGVVASWLKQEYRGEELSGMNDHVKYIHTKYMLIDPLSDNPIVITGSANFSKPSTQSNDENMLIIRGDTRVADIYLGEFMRLFSHFRRRGLAAAAKTKKQQEKFLWLCPDDSWTEPFYEQGSAKMQERLMFG